VAKETKPKPSRRHDFELSDFVVAIDTREQHPFGFRGFKCDADKNHRPLIIKTEPLKLDTGDYSIIGLEHLVSVERKSLDDAYNTFGADRERWERELERFSKFQFGAVVVEADWSAVFNMEREPSKFYNRNFTPKMFHRSVLAWQQDYPNVHWHFCFSRQFAEHTTFRILNRFWHVHKAQTQAER